MTNLTKEDELFEKLYELELRVLEESISTHGKWIIKDLVNSHNTTIVWFRDTSTYPDLNLLIEEEPDIIINTLRKNPLDGSAAMYLSNGVSSSLRKELITLRNEIVSNNIALVKHLVINSHHSKTLYDNDDLLQVGYIGLVRAVEKYYTKSNNKFSTYAQYWIKGRALDYINYTSSLIYIPSEVKDVHFSEVSVKDDTLDSDRMDKLSWDDVLQVGVSGRDANTPEDLLYLKELKLIVQTSLAKNKRLSDRDKEIVSLRYGIGSPAKTLTYLGKKYGVSKQRIEQIEKRVMDILSGDKKLVGLINEIKGVSL